MFMQALAYCLVTMNKTSLLNHGNLVRISKKGKVMFCFLKNSAVLFVNLRRAAAMFSVNYFLGEPRSAVMPCGYIQSLCVEGHSYVLLSLIVMARDELGELRI